MIPTAMKRQNYEDHTNISGCWEERKDMYRYTVEF